MSTTEPPSFATYSPGYAPSAVDFDPKTSLSGAETVDNSVYKRNNFRNHNNRAQKIMSISGARARQNPDKIIVYLSAALRYTKDSNLCRHKTDGSSSYKTKRKGVFRHVE